MSEQLFFGFLLYSLCHLIIITAYPMDAMGFIIKAPKDESLTESIIFVIEDVVISALTFGILYMICTFVFGLFH